MLFSDSSFGIRALNVLMEAVLLFHSMLCMPEREGFGRGRLLPLLSFFVFVYGFAKSD